MNAGGWSGIFGWILDFLALGTLAATMEIPIPVLCVIPIVFALRRFERLRPSPRGMLTLLIMIVGAGLFSWLYLKYPPILTAACIGPIFHAALWLAPDDPRYRGWRIGMGFVDLVLTSAITSEVFLSIALCLFVVLGSVALSCNFLDREIGKRAIPTHYIRSSILIALIIFPMSAAIFPLLPRMKDGATLGFGGTDTKIGYSEEVSLSNWSSLSMERGSKPVLWLYPEEKVDLAIELYRGLIRGRTLELFDSVRWKPAPRNVQLDPTVSPPAIHPHPEEFAKSLNVDVVLDSLGSEILPVPYGTYAVAPSESDAPFPIERLRSSEWTGKRGEGGRLHYNFLFSPTLQWFDRNAIKRDLPISSLHLQVPPELQNPRMRKLADKIFAGAETDREKILNVLAFFRREKFEASLNDGQDAQVNENAPAGFHGTRLERFLFVTKSGHCEWFSSATAMLLRMVGVPTRLVAGFRLPQQSSDAGGEIVLRGNDAHAWVEAYTADRGWIPLDPTPRILKPASLLNSVVDAYESVSAFWYRYILSYSDQSRRTLSSNLLGPQGMVSHLSGWRTQLHDLFAAHWKGIALAAFNLAGLIAAIYFWLRWQLPWVFSIRYRVREGSPRLRRERILMERWAKRVLKLEDLFAAQTLPDSAQSWRTVYLESRFGRTPESTALARLRELRREASQAGPLTSPPLR